MNILNCRKWREECENKSKPYLLRTIAQTFWPEYLLIGFVALLFDVVAPLSLPFLLKQLLEYFRYKCFPISLIVLLKRNACV